MVYKDFFTRPTINLQEKVDFFFQNSSFVVLAHWN